MTEAPPEWVESKPVTSYTLLLIISQQLLAELCVLTSDIVYPDGAPDTFSEAPASATEKKAIVAIARSHVFPFVVLCVFTDISSHQ